MLTEVKLTDWSCSKCGRTVVELEPVQGVTASKTLPAQWKCNGCGHWNDYDLASEEEKRET